MNVFKKFFSRFKSKKNKKAQDDKSRYNNNHEKKRKRWHPPVDGGYYDGTLHDMAVTNQISKRQQ